MLKFNGDEAARGQPGLTGVRGVRAHYVLEACWYYGVKQGGGGGHLRRALLLLILFHGKLVVKSNSINVVS